MKKYFFGSIAILLAITAVAFNNAEPEQTVDSNLVNYFYRFDGSPGDEDDMTKWTQITQGAYDSLPCSGSAKACKITNTTIDLNNHPTEVPLNGSGLPEQTGVNVQVKNKAS